MPDPKVLSIVLAGGEGKRLLPLTIDRAKPAVPFGGTYRLIDFVLSNLVNSGLRAIVVLTQYKSHSLDRHISETWRFSSQLGNYIASVPAQQRVGKSWFQGSADAIYQSLNLVYDAKPDVVVVAGADHVYRMDFRQMIEAHMNSGAACTVAAVRQPLALSDQFGVIETDPNDPERIARFVEKPETTEGLPDAPGEFLASMGNYVFDARALVGAVRADAGDQYSKRDMGGDIIPAFVARGEAGVYDFSRNTVPGASERDKDYWRDVGTIDAFYDAHMDLIAPVPLFNLYNMSWPLYTRHTVLPPAKFIHDVDNHPGRAVDSIVAPGVVVSGGYVEGSVVSDAVKIDSLAAVSSSIIMNDVHIGRGARVHKAILDKNVFVPPGETVGIFPELDAERGFTVTESGLTVVAKNQVVDDNPFEDPWL
ncbi:glucose-1-phosphate adenylyltransferase [Sediminivirga luteola]|uniref:Glucose-1-phosphate adenylyltransferase n=1 Tax=Sediminivirga luteola TaxID=1774748 RepID=A0A8J2XM45_9MICO|nr:glucose-1-phosphate adenylyltransferase [Sediminivirga luteola]MCI2263995.1 glucose-1-phosphate adenylyltransferase [Sediminivirga luteola]GGA23124.1 glucose-1-phosphate adenylyltransferase [Sediminivirga luteola]